MGHSRNHSICPRAALALALAAAVAASWGARPSFGATVLDIKMDSGSFVDVSGHGHTITNSGVTASTAQTYNGAASSAYFDGGSYLSIGASSDFSFGTGDFKIEAWFYASVADEGYGGIVTSAAANTAQGDIQSGFLGYMGPPGYAPDLNKISFYQAPALAFTLSATLTPGRWYDVAFQRRGDVAELLVDGAIVGSQALSTGYVIDFNATGLGLAIGRRYAQYNAFYFTGYMSEVTITTGAPVPEPTASSLALLMTGCVAVRRRFARA